MAISTPPPPPPPDPSSTTTNPTSTTRPIFPRPPYPFYSTSPSRLPSNPNPNYPQLAPRPPHPHSHDPFHLPYPVSSYGRGFITRPVARSSPRAPFVFPYPDQGQGNPGFVRPIHFPPQLILGSGPASTGGVGVTPDVVKGVHVSSQTPKVCPPSTSTIHGNGHKDLRDGNRDDAHALAIVRGRKVRIHDDSSLYALCRSWLRNGAPEETQPQYPDAVKSLPKPFPPAAQVVDSPEGKKGDKEEEDEDEGSIDDMSTRELLQTHIKRAKRVRSRLRDKRLQRISRYKKRLALLLPPMVEQHMKNESD